MPLTLFRVKTTCYASLRPSERPIFLPSTICYPRNDERWLKAPTAPGFGLSILPNDEKVRKFGGYKHIYVFKEGKVIPGDLILYRTALDHYSLEPALPMELDGRL